jgi:hypothetical protein
VLLFSLCFLSFSLSLSLGSEHARAVQTAHQKLILAARALLQKAKAAPFALSNCTAGTTSDIVFIAARNGKKCAASQHYHLSV